MPVILCARWMVTQRIGSDHLLDALDDVLISAALLNLANFISTSLFFLAPLLEPCANFYHIAEINARGSGTAIPNYQSSVSIRPPLPAAACSRPSSLSASTL